MTQIFTQGKFARLNGVSSFTLRLYDRIGILKPAFIGKNGYHLYTDDQFQQLLFIDLCIKSGFSLKEIRTLQSEIRGPEEMLELLQGIRKRIHRKQVEYSSCERMLDSMIYYHEASYQQAPNRLFVEDGLHYHGFLSEPADFFLEKNAELSQMFIRRTEERLGHPIEFPLSYLIDLRDPELSWARLILRMQEQSDGENFYDSRPPSAHCIKAYRSDKRSLQEKIREFLRELQQEYEPFGAILLTPVQDYMFHSGDQQSSYVAGVPVRRITNLSECFR